MSPDASRSTLSHIMMVTDTNLFGTVHGGVIAKLWERRADWHLEALPALGDVAQAEPSGP